MQIPRLPAAGDPSIVAQLRTVLFSEPILAAANMRPKGFMKLVIAPLLGWWAPYLMRRATDPLPPTRILVAVTPVDIRLFSKSGLRDAFEIGRWAKSSYRASSRPSAAGLRLDLELERLGKVTLFAARRAQPVIDLVLQGASGPVL